MRAAMGPQLNGKRRKCRRHIIKVRNPSGSLNQPRRAAEYLTIIELNLETVTVCMEVDHRPFIYCWHEPALKIECVVS